MKIIWRISLEFTRYLHIAASYYIILLDFFDVILNFDCTGICFNLFFDVVAA